MASSTPVATSGPIAGDISNLKSWEAVVLVLGVLVAISAMGDPWAWVGFGSLIFLALGILVAWSQGRTLSWE
jgi:hypothetical protein